MTDPICVYVHIPYCAQVCHYCDFAKTANFSEQITADYFSALRNHARYWLKLWKERHPSGQVETLYFGGGTPSLFTDELGSIVDVFRTHLMADAEITLEVNPEHLTQSTASAWRSLGFNRLSLGLQSFNARGLQFLTRTHSPKSGRASLDVACQNFSNVSVDFIYGWPTQTLTEWQTDLQTALDSGASHFSAYGLTYEPLTTIGRRQKRGLLQPPSEEHEAALFLLAHQHLQHHGALHYEISNYARPNKQSRHNSNYWRGESYLAIGAGAHGFIKELGPYGLRYHYPKNDRAFMQISTQNFPVTWSQLNESAFASTSLKIDQRDEDGWLLEKISCGLRTKAGININSLSTESGREFSPTPHLQRALNEGLATLSKEGVLSLSPEEWFREQSWCVEVFHSLTAADSFGSSLSKLRK